MTSDDAGTASAVPPAGSGVRGILASVADLDRWLHVVLVALAVVCAIRYVTRHPLDASGVFVLAGATAFIAVYASGALLRGRSWWPTLWVVVVVALWAGLTLVAPSFAWTAVPVAFAALRVLPFGYAAGVVVAMTAVVSLGWSRLVSGPDPTIVVGPVGIALVTVIAFRTLEREARTRQRLLDDLTAAQDDLALAERRAGALAERTRLSRDIHDSVGQGLSSINLLLQAAAQDWDRRPDLARTHVGTAASTAREGLEEVRRVVRDLAPADFVEGAPDALPGALRKVVAEAAPGVATELRVHGTPVPVSPAVAGAMVRTTRGALANVVEHAGARRAVVSVTYDAGEVLLDVRDDGRGFDLGRVGRAARGRDRGHGLDGIRQRAAALGGRADVESTPGEGTTVSLALPTGAGS